MEKYPYSPCLHGVDSDNYAFSADIATRKVRLLTLRSLTLYIYGHLFLMFLDHTQRRSTVGRTPLDE